VTRRAALALGLGALAIAAGWRLAGPATPPLYDGPQIVAPYLYYCIPPGYHQSRPAQSKTQTMAIADIGQGLFVSTDEPPVAQVQVLIGANALTLPAGATDATVTITPGAPPAQLPTDGSLDGNVYTIAVSSGGKPVTLVKDQAYTVVLRGEPGKPTSAVEQFDGHAWHHGSIEQPVGQNDIYAANFTSFGTFALVTPGAPGTATTCRTFDQAGEPGSSSSSSGAAGSGDGGSAVLPIVAVVGGLLLLGGGILALRVRR
jgi:hypothetical protein